MNVSAKWIASPKDTGTAAVTFSKGFNCGGPIKRATLYASSVGVYVPRINGQRVGKNVLAPGWTSYKNRILYQEYDITNDLSEENLIEISVGQGWAVGYIGRFNNNHFYYDRVAAVAHISIEYEDGTVYEIVSDDEWDVYTSCVTSTEIYHGETVDMTAPISFIGKAVTYDVRAKLVEQDGELIVENERISPLDVIRTPKGELVLDFGQNMAGYVEIKIQAPRGSRIVVHHSEVLDGEGNFYNANNRHARQENIYVCSGGEDVFKPSFTTQGFRYIRLTEFPLDTVDKRNFRAIAVHSDIKRTGSFKCGNEKINQLYHNTVWGQKSNYLDIPTDCPQRDERLGWTGDAQMFFNTAAYNYDVEKFFKKWLTDVAIEQLDNGAITGTCPIPTSNPNRISAGWGDAACIIPWKLYLSYGNKELLDSQFGMMKKWVDYIHATGNEENLWLGGFHYGDWLAMDAGTDSYDGATSHDLIASAFFAYSTSLLIKAGEVLNKDIEEYRVLYKNIRTAFREYFMENGMPKDKIGEGEELAASVGISQPPKTESGRGMTQTGIVLILHFGLCEECERKALAEKLVELIHNAGDIMTTGFIGTPYLLHVLSDNGYTSLAYKLLMNECVPSWLYSVNHGATTMWEHWNGIKEDGSFWSTDMNSFNHYAYGSVFDWIFGVSCGIKPISPAYKEISINPHPDKCLGFADTSLKTRNGEIFARWYYKGDTVYYEFDIPEQITAAITLPSGYTETVSGGKYCYAEKNMETR